MSTARKVLMIIAFVASILGVLIMGVCALALFISTGNEELLNKIVEGLDKTDLSPERAKVFVCALGVAFSIVTLLQLINAILSIKGVKSSRVGLMIINIIFGVISGIYVNSLGGIFGLVDGKKD